MSVLFDIAGMQWPVDCDGCAEPPAHMFVQLSEINAADFLRWIELGTGNLYGEIRARELAPILRRRLWPARREADDVGIAGFLSEEHGRATLIECGRPAGRLAEYAVRLLALAEFAGDGVIIWG